MNILFSSTPPIPLHALAALIAMLLGGVQLYLSKGTPLHKLIGRIWIGLMAVVSLSSFFIYELKIWGNGRGESGVRSGIFIASEAISAAFTDHKET